jgi:hypothetical protein
MYLIQGGAPFLYVYHPEAISLNIINSPNPANKITSILSRIYLVFLKERIY